ncbi:TIM barrel protein [Humisphaera borealis]|uniref:TIM barrel protein n=2 Tax=Humisphaera borealis TaxID=2807512 RepID=A0A7M2X3Z0_9BACT|nr:TIM barrel protein [Humisphaera borealis]
MNRRSLLRGAFVAAASTALAGPLAFDALGAADAAAKPRLRKAVKFGMIGLKGATIEEKFALIKKIGYEGVEMDSPSGVNPAEAAAAAKKVGIEIHGVVISTHWGTRHSDPDEKVRAKAFDHLIGALKDAKTYGASTVLLVPGVVKNQTDENFDLVWQRSTAAVKKALPTAKELGVKIAIEVVWNNFITSSDMLIKYVDQFNDPAVGAYFDCSNMIKYGEPSATWIRKLGKRMLKFDFKGYNGKTNKWVPIGEGTEDWPEIRKALVEIGYEGWATSEVGGGGEDKLREIAKQMDEVLGLKA